MGFQFCIEFSKSIYLIIMADACRPFVSCSADTFVDTGSTFFLWAIVIIQTIGSNTQVGSTIILFVLVDMIDNLSSFWFQQKTMHPPHYGRVYIAVVNVPRVAVQGVPIFVIHQTYTPVH